MSPLVRALLLGGSMAISAVTILLPMGATGCTCDGKNSSFCLDLNPPDAGACCDPGEAYYSCNVELEGEGPASFVYHAVTVGGCYPTADEAQADGPALAEMTYGSEYPNTTGRTTICTATTCPGGGT